MKTIEELEQNLEDIKSQADYVERELDKLKKPAQPTPEQWQQVVDLGCLVAVGNGSQEQVERLAREPHGLSQVKIVNGQAFMDNGGTTWNYAAIPYGVKGIKLPHFGGPCPVDKMALVSIYLKNGAIRISNAGTWTDSWADGSIVAYIIL